MSATLMHLEETVGINAGSQRIFGTLTIPERAWAAVLFAQGSGSSRHSARNKFVAESLHELGFATLMLDLLTPSEQRIDAFSAQYRFDITLLKNRLLSATDWLETNYAQYNFRIGYFSASTGTAAALMASTERPSVAAVVSRGGRPDLMGNDLSYVSAATLLIAGELDSLLIDLNRKAYEFLSSAYRRELIVVPGATHLFEEPGAMDDVASLTGQFFVRYLGAAATRRDEKQTERSTVELQSAR